MIHDRRAIALSGAESVGKTTLALMLAGRLRTHGIQAVYVAEPGAALPFDPARFDTEPELFEYMTARLLAAQADAALRSPPGALLLCDRVPMDFVCYLRVKHSKSSALLTAAAYRSAAFDAVYHLPAKGAAYVEDGRRAAQAHNDWRDAVCRETRSALPKTGVAVDSALSPRERGEFVYHHILSTQFGLSRSARVAEQLRVWLRDMAPGIDCEVQMMGSRSVTRFHPASDHDDFDVQVVVPTTADASAVHALLQAHRHHLEPMIQGSLDAWAVARGQEPYET